MKIISIVSVILILAGILSCTSSTTKLDSDDNIVIPKKNLVERTDTCGLIILYPVYEKVDLVCGTMPSQTDSSALLCVEACFTGECLNEFKHFNIAGDHVSGGTRYHGYKCKRNTGAFVFYNGAWKFLYKNYSDEMNIAADNHGAAFAQEMIIHEGKIVETTRSNSNRNQFRALCQIDNRLCVIESANVLSFGDYKAKLNEIKVQEALYLDMGAGWNHAWYRTNVDSLTVLHPRTHNYCTNWITFYK